MTLSKYADPIEEAREGLSVEDASKVAQEDPGLIYIEGIVNSLDDLLPSLTDAWYEEVEGVYTSVPTFGQETQEVKNRIAMSCGDGDIVSWDTRAAEIENHLYLLRRWTPASQDNENDFRIERHGDL